MSREILQDIISDFSPDKFTRFFREKNRSFAPRQESFTHYNDEYFSDGIKLGEIKFSESEKLVVCAFKANQPLSERSGKKAQYEKGKTILKNTSSNAGIFIFYDRQGHFRFSLIYPEAIGNRRQWSNFRRFTYFVSREFTNKTFLLRIGDGGFSSLEKVKDVFSLSAVTDIFYKDFFVEYSKLVEAVKKKNKSVDQEKARDFVLLLAVRTIFLGFIQKKGWIGNDEKFIQNLLKEYEKNYSGKDLFYKRWLTPLFFQALNSPPGRKVAYGDNDFSESTEKNFQMAPYLNGGLFKEKPDYDDQGYFVPDKELKGFFDFLFSHNFTIEENSYEDEDLQLNPEFLGIIFERLVNKADGAVYTPRTEVDLMCRLSLVKWLEKNISLPIQKSNLYELFFREGEKEEDQKHGSFSEKETKEILGFLENVTVCDPAVGSGAFLVGMMQVLDEIEQNLKARISLKDDDTFERKKRIIAQSLYGVEVKEWAVWICQLRLWLSLFIEAPDEMKNSFKPILPSLDFKVRQGDSLVQRIGSKFFPVSGHASLPPSIKAKVTQLKNLKIEYFQNRINNDWEVRNREMTIFKEILKSEIDELRNEIFRIKETKPEKQIDFFNSGEKEVQLKIDFDKEKVAKIEKEIVELREELDALRDEKPLIWNIEFAEIFVEKGGFEIVIGNPPYVRKEDIADPTNKIKDKKQYKRFLSEMVSLDFPADFPPKSKINAQSDLYTYFYIRALRLLSPKGIHTFICSNSWLDVGYGDWLQKFLLERAPVEFIIDNHAKRSFEAADVNTIISIINAPIKKINGDNLVKFVAFKKPFEETVFTEYLLQIAEAKKVISNDIFRVYPITINNLKEAGNEYEDEVKKQKEMKIGKYVGEKWGGRFLRAPDIFLFRIFNNKNLKSLAEFCSFEGYIHDNNVSAEFPRTKIVLSSQSINKINITQDYSEVEMVGVRKRGNSRTIPDFVIPRTFSENFIVARNTGKILFKRFYKVLCKNDKWLENLSFILNSTIQVFFWEYIGIPAGLGALNFYLDDFKRVKIIDPGNINFPEKVIKSFVNREIRSIFTECGIDPKSKVPIEEQEPKPLPDRAELDKIVFDALDLTVDERKDVYRAVCRLVWNRISKAKSV